MGTIKDRNSRDLADAKEFKKRWKEYMEKLYKKDLKELDNYDSVVNHSELDILECEVKWASGSTAIPVELFKTLKDDTIKMLHSICQQNPAVATGLEKVNSYPNSKEGQY